MASHSCLTVENVASFYAGDLLCDAIRRVFGESLKNWQFLIKKLIHLLYTTVMKMSI